MLLQTLPAAPGRLLPLAPLWKALHARSTPKAGEVRVATTGDDRCVAVLAYCAAGASTFERLAIAGRALKALAAVRPLPARIGALAGARTDSERWLLLEAIAAAASAHGFGLPSAKAEPRPLIAEVHLFGARARDIARMQASADATNLVRHLTALPPNQLDARAYRRLCAALARRHGLRMEWLGERQLTRAGAGAFLAVSRGSATRDAGIAHLSWRPPGHTGPPDVALVGKGIVFDTGGTNLKPHRSMLDMHTDMAGSAVVLSALVAIATLKPRVAVDAWLAITDNAIGSRAYRPQEVIRAANGTSIQIIHSDAEGRLVLADALTLAARTQPRTIIDFATLTGACVYALTERRSGVFANRDDLRDALCGAGVASGERLWPFPLDEDYDSDLDSAVADIAQCAVEGKGDHILAARFLQRFVPETQAWAHVDLSSATRHGGLAHVPTEITGFGVRLTLSLLLDGGLPGSSL